MNKEKIVLLLLLFSSLRLPAQFALPGLHAIDHQARYVITGDSTISRKAPAEVQPGENNPETVVKKKRAVQIHLPAARKWSFKAMMYAVRDYINNGVSAKYQPAVLLTADTR